MNAEQLKRLFRKRRASAFFLMLSATLTAVYLIDAALYREPLLSAYAAVTCALALLGWRIGRRYAVSPLAPEAVQTARVLFDRTHKRAFGWLFFNFLWCADLVYSALAISVNNSKPQELLEFLQSIIPALEIMVIGLGVNLLLSRWTAGFGRSEWRHRFAGYLVLCSAVSLFYWGGLLWLFGTFNTASFFTFVVAAAVYLLLALLFCSLLRRRVVYQNFAFHPMRLGIAVGIAIFLALYLLLQRDVWLTQPYINRVPNVSERTSNVSYNDETGVYTITNPGGDFRILQLTDIHLGGSYSSYNNDIKALKACFALIEHTRPDLVVVTGDLCFPMGLASFSLNNTAPVMQFAAFMRNTGIPWAFTYGNHDTEAIASADRETLDDLYRSLSWKTSRNLMYPYVQPAVTGRSNQLIEVRNPDGTLNTALFLIDSNAYTGRGFNSYDFIHDDQVDWYAGEVERLNAEAGHIVSSLAFFHIPLQQYKTAYELYESGSDEVRYFFGSNDEKMFDKVCCSDYPSSLFDRMKELGSTTAVFCGHDHYNNMSLEYQGIRLTYGMSIDYLVMPNIARDTGQRGATLITLHPDSSYDIEQVPLTSIPAPE